MSTGLSKYTAAVRSKPLGEYDWWKHHVLFFAVFFVALPGVLTLYYGLGGLYAFLGIKPVVRVLAQLAMYAMIATVLVTIVGSFVGYYYDAKYIESLEGEWSPRWGVYMLIHLIPVMGPFAAIPLYVIQRYRHVGLPMGDLF